ncbi:SGNH/GDSL hydrolase family protein [Hamadaea sp.]|uniref:SGNH/GDSL hydrolase family protein n=1 Tax=Hamadaea sp. TaxID=2024425 RepID=UPI0025BD550F|nr:SGNH/GDSL hydrolase family protein [Hamadaea sp.]
MSYVRKMLQTAGTVVALVLGSTTAVSADPAAPPPDGWVGTWSAAATGTVPNLPTGYADRTIRNVVHTSVGGSGVRVTLTNVLGTTAVRMDAVTVAVAAVGTAPNAVAGTMRSLTFGGATSVTIPAGGEALSDPIPYAVPEDGDLLVSVYTPAASGPVTYHQVANQTSYLSVTGDHAAEESGAAFTSAITFWPYVSGVDVLGEAEGAVVTLGDSITDGNASTRNANHRWPDYLADRLIAEPGATRLGVLNAGISSNRLLSNTWNPNALSRLDRDVLTAPGARSVVVLLGINDIGGQPQHHEPSEIIAGLRQVAAQVQAKGMRITGGTLTPFGGSSNYTEELEGVRQAVNAFIRDSGVFDAVADFDAALRDPAAPTRLRPDYDSGDHLHPKDAGYQAMAAVVDLDKLDSRPAGHWVSTWQTAMARTTPGADLGMPNYSIRNVVHTSVGGDAARVRLSNALGSAPVLMGRVTAALATRPDGPEAVAGTMREVTFGGLPSVTIPAGAEVLSDPIALDVPADADLLVTVYTPSPSGPVTEHPRSYQTSFRTADGDHAADEQGSAFTQPTTAWYYVTGVDVSSSGVHGAVVTFGDSITDGDRSTTSANHRWPDILADRLAAENGPTKLGVVNSGLSGNRILDSSTGTGIGGPNAYARLNRDMLTTSGARTVIVLEGVNDILNLAHPDPEALKLALKQLAAQAHAQGLRVIVGTITPIKGWRSYTEERDAVRQAVNSYIRTSADFDAVIDFDAVVRDPADPQRIDPAYDSGDHLHPSDAGYRVMAEAIDLRTLR